MPFKDSKDGQTHYYGDGCIPPHVMDVNTSQADIKAFQKPFVYPPSCPKCHKPFEVAWDDISGSYNPHLLEPKCDHYPKDVLISIG